MAKLQNQSSHEITALMVQHTHQAAAFAHRYLSTVDAKKASTTGELVDCFNSAMTIYVGEKEYGGQPHPLFEDLHNSLGDNKKNIAVVMDGLIQGVRDYRIRNGGEMPCDTVIAAAFSDAQALVNHFNSIGVMQSPALALVPEIVAASMYSRLASTIPIAMPLPNPNGSGEVPLLVCRMTAFKTFGAMTKGDPIDGSRGGLPFMTAKREFAMSNGGSGLTYTITPRVAYANYAALTPNTNTPIAPFKGGRVAILVNGVKIAHDSFKGHKVNAGTSQLVAVPDVVLESTAITATAATANLDTHLISVTFAAALPANAVVTAEIILDYERKDGNGNFLITAPSLDIATDEETVRSVQHQATMSVSQGALETLRRQTGFDPVASGIALLQSNFYLEQTLQVLRQAKRKALAYGAVVEFDASRGVVDGAAAAYNTAQQLFAEVLRKKDEAAQKINKQTAGTSFAYDIFCTERVATLFNTLSVVNGYKRLAAVVGVNNAIVRIGQFDDGTNIYVLPTNDAPVLTDSNDLKASELLVVARSSDPVRAPIVSITAVPPITLEFAPNFFEQGVGMFVDSDMVINPLERFGMQFALIEMVNLPN
jgi:hypothetical protein